MSVMDNFLNSMPALWQPANQPWNAAENGVWQANVGTVQQRALQGRTDEDIDRMRELLRLVFAAGCVA